MHHGVLWGISESGYNMVDVHLNYSTCIRRTGLGSTRSCRGPCHCTVCLGLALMVAPEAACLNLQRLAQQGLREDSAFLKQSTTPQHDRRAGKRTRCPGLHVTSPGHEPPGPGLYLLDRPMQQRFESDPLFRSTTLLLQERVPKPRLSIRTPRSSPSYARLLLARRPRTCLQQPGYTGSEVQLLSNPDTTSCQNSGGGYSRWKDMAVTRSRRHYQ